MTKCHRWYSIRRRLESWLGSDVAEATVQDFLLLVTELVTNAYEHGTPPCHVRISRTGIGLVRIEVDDQSADPPIFGRDAHGAASDRGRGIVMVNALASRWGVTPNEWGKTVWAEVRI